MWFDAATAVFIHGAIDLLFCLATVYAWRVSVRLSCVKQWALGLLAFALGHALMFAYYLSGAGPGGALWALLPAAGYLAHSLGINGLTRGAELLLGYKTAPRWPSVAVSLGLVAGWYFSAVAPSEGARIVVGNLVYTALSLRGLAVFVRKVDGDWRPGLTGILAGLCFLGIAALNALRAVSAALGMGGGFIFVSGLYNSVHALMTVALMLTLSQLVYAQFNDRLRLKIRDNELLVREVHHRTKNNLALVSSIIALEGGGQADGQARDAFESVRGRVLAMSALHDRLQRGGSEPDVELGPYLEDIAEGVASSIGRPDIEMSAACDASALVPVGSAISLGLVANELMTNAIKHAFPAGGGKVSLGLSVEGEELVLRVEDDGVGPKATDEAHAAALHGGLGTLILESLVAQLGANLRVGGREGGGTAAELRLPVPEATRRT